ncbi:M61 family metallopeptidase [Psychrobacter urativorans]|uniref:Peptidase M61 n=1 Tax=Psychrobacter urativorans TaxID=45610 RepID=A0A0M3V8Y5_9GAMM|nr:PDZ domain-containing protein [Psychrobacter urativorans]ALF59993.1 peptidase M61 [Psychrobacter urativorans]
MTQIIKHSAHLSTNAHSTDIHYCLNFERFYEHLIDVTLTFTADSDTPQLWLPAWIPGSYLMREFARHITAVHYQITDNNDKDGDNKDSKSYRAQKIDKHTWQLPEVKTGQAVTVNYEVYCYDLSVRTAYVDQQRLYGNFTSLALAVEGQEHLPIRVSLLVPAAFLADKNADNVVLACGLEATHLRSVSEYSAGHVYGLYAHSYEQLIDHPFEIAIQDRFDFIIQDNKHQTLSHRFFISGKHSTNMGRLQQDVTKICQTYLNWLGDAPFSDYTFMTYASGNDYGGLEHINSTSLITPRRDLPSIDEPQLPSASYQRFLGLCSHEYFHAWWVKTVRPDVMLDVDLRKEAFTPLLWVFEGFTSYIDDFMLQASGVIDKASYLTLLADQISRYYQTHGRAHQSVAESSFDAWIKLYRNDENTGNAGISYYNKGALVALCLDLTLMEKSAGRYRLFDVVKAFYEQAKANDNCRIGISSADMGTVIGQFMPVADWEEFERRYVNGVEELPLEKLLTANGIKIHADIKDTADKHVPWGMRCSETPAGLKVNRVQRDSIAAKAGISANDVIVAMDGIKADSKQLASLKTAQHDIDCHLFRRDELLRVTVAPNADNEKSSLTLSYPHQINLRLARMDSVATSESNHRGSAQAWEAWLDVIHK